MEKILSRVVRCSAIIAFIAICCGVGLVLAEENAGEVVLSKGEQGLVKEVLQDVNSAASSGDERLVAKLLLDAVKRNPKIAGKIMREFLAAHKNSSQKDKNSIDTAAIINNIVASLQQKKGNEAVVASVLSSVETASGSNLVNISNSPPAILPPALPPALPLGSGSENFQKENPNHASPH
jgi:hypothetical protein